jgi:hypothetical protein
MNDNRREILEMLAAGKISAGEAERLIAALEKGTTPGSMAAGSESSPKAQPRYLRVLVESDEGEKNGPAKVNVRVPMQLLRAGVKLASLIPSRARDQVNDALRVKGLVIDLNQIKPENLEELVAHLNELTVDVDQKNTKVRFFCE